MRICLLSLDFPPFRTSGLTIYAENITRGLAERGHFVKVIAASRPEHLKLESNYKSHPNISILRVDVGPLDWIGFGFYGAKLLKKMQGCFDVIHFVDVHFAYAYRGAFIASAFQSFRQRLTSNRGNPYYVNWKDKLFRLIYYNFARYIMEKPSVKRATCIIMSSDSTRREFINHYGVQPGRAITIYPGIDLSRFTLEINKAEARRRLGLPEEKPLLLYVGFSNPRKGLRHLVEALDVMRNRAHLVIVGRWDPHYFKAFKKLLKGELKSRIHIEGYVKDEILPLYFAAADVFVLPTLLEGFGLPLVEAMAAKLPIVTTTGGAAKEVVGEAGLAIEPSNKWELATAIDRLLDDRDFALHLGWLGYQRAHRLFRIERFINDLERIYERFGPLGS